MRSASAVRGRDFADAKFILLFGRISGLLGVMRKVCPGSSAVDMRRGHNKHAAGSIAALRLMVDKNFSCDGQLMKAVPSL